MSEFPTTVVDEDGNVHHLLPQPLGRGGQGVVLRTRSPHIAVKLIGAVLEPPQDKSEPRGSAQKLWDRMTSTSGFVPGHEVKKQQSLRQRLENVRMLPLPRLHLAQPLSMLRNHVGYTMRLLTGMVPIRNLIAPPGTTSLAEFYQNGGGLRRRLEILAKAASLFARLHALPLVYADISPNNVFISETVDASEVWLIDLDNLDYVSTNAPGIYTPGFGAPEIVTGRAGMTTLSDAFSFAVLAFYVLTQVHPFLGDYVEEGGWDADEDREQLAFRGEVPWIEDPHDDSNHTRQGIPRHLVLSNPVRELFERTFGPGRKDRTARPSLSEWVDVLRQAADRTLSCKKCQSTFDVTAGTCPFCTANIRPPFIHMQINRWDPDLDDLSASAVSTRPIWHKMLDGTQWHVVRRHVVEPILAHSDDEPVLGVRVMPNGIAIERLANLEVYAVVDNQLHRIDSDVRLRLPTAGKEAYLHFGDMKRPHRMAALRYYPEGA